MFIGGEQSFIDGEHRFFVGEHTLLYYIAMPTGWREERHFRTFHDVLEPIPTLRCFILIHRANWDIKGGVVIYVRKGLIDGMRMFY